MLTDVLRLKISSRNKSSCSVSGCTMVLNDLHDKCYRTSICLSVETLGFLSVSNRIRCQYINFYCHVRYYLNVPYALVCLVVAGYNTAAAASFMTHTWCLC